MAHSGWMTSAKVARSDADAEDAEMKFDAYTYVWMRLVFDAVTEMGGAIA